MMPWLYNIRFGSGSVRHWQWSETPQNLCRPTGASYLVVRWTPKISSPQNCNNNMLKKFKQLLPRALALFTEQTTCSKSWVACILEVEIDHHPCCGFTKLMMWKHIMRVRKNVSRFTSVVVVRPTKKIVGPPDPLSWWSCGLLLIKVCVKPCQGALFITNLYFGKKKTFLKSA